MVRAGLLPTLWPPLGHTLGKGGQSPWCGGSTIHAPVLRLNGVGSDELCGSLEVEAGSSAPAPPAAPPTLGVAWLVVWTEWQQLGSV